MQCVAHGVGYEVIKFATDPEHVYFGVHLLRGCARAVCGAVFSVRDHMGMYCIVHMYACR